MEDEQKCSYPIIPSRPRCRKVNTEISFKKFNIAWMSRVSWSHTFQGYGSVNSKQILFIKPRIEKAFITMHLMWSLKLNFWIKENTNVLRLQFENLNHDQTSHPCLGRAQPRSLDDLFFLKIESNILPRPFEPKLCYRPLPNSVSKMCDYSLSGKITDGFS